VVKRLVDIWFGSAWGEANDIVVMGTRLYFEATDGSSGHELWAHETTNGSTWQASDIWSGSGHGYANNITVMGTRLYFGANDGSSGYELHMMEIEHSITYD
jgi:ELWxxDGT repeat protein